MSFCIEIVKVVYCAYMVPGRKSWLFAKIGIKNMSASLQLV